MRRYNYFRGSIEIASNSADEVVDLLTGGPRLGRSQPESFVERTDALDSVTAEEDRE